VFVLPGKKINLIVLSSCCESSLLHSHTDLSDRGRLLQNNEILLWHCYIQWYCADNRHNLLISVHFLHFVLSDKFQQFTLDE